MRKYICIVGHMFVLLGIQDPPWDMQNIHESLAFFKTKVPFIWIQLLKADFWNNVSLLSFRKMSSDSLEPIE